MRRNDFKVTNNFIKQIVPHLSILTIKALMRAKIAVCVTTTYSFDRYKTWKIHVIFLVVDKFCQIKYFLNALIYLGEIPSSQIMTSGKIQDSVKTGFGCLKGY